MTVIMATLQGFGLVGVIPTRIVLTGDQVGSTPGVISGAVLVAGIDNTSNIKLLQLTATGGLT